MQKLRRPQVGGEFVFFVPFAIPGFLMASMAVRRAFSSRSSEGYSFDRTTTRSGKSQHVLRRFGEVALWLSSRVV
jgi:hypothetical protein